MRAWIGLVAAGAVACGGQADVRGTLGGLDFGDRAVAYHGATHILIADRDLDCIALDWVQNRYFDGVPPSERLEFTAVQLTLDNGEEWSEGTYPVGEGAEVRSWGMILEDGTFDLYRGRTGSLTLDSVDLTTLEGTFSVAFSNDALAGVFVSEACRNIRP